MKKFLKPTIFKIIITVILIIAAFGGEIFYDRNISLDANNNIAEPDSIIIKEIGFIAGLISFPMRFIANSAAKLFGSEIYILPLTNFLLKLTMLAILIAETYLISCLAGLFFYKRK